MGGSDIAPLNVPASNCAALSRLGCHGRASGKSCLGLRRLQVVLDHRNARVGRLHDIIVFDCSEVEQGLLLNRLRRVLGLLPVVSLTRTSLLLLGLGLCRVLAVLRLPHKRGRFVHYWMVLLHAFFIFLKTRYEKLQKNCYKSGQILSESNFNR